MEIIFFSFFLAQMHAKVLEQKKKVQQVMFFFVRFHNMPFLKDEDIFQSFESNFKHIQIPTEFLQGHSKKQLRLRQ